MQESYVDYVEHNIFLHSDIINYEKNFLVELSSIAIILIFVIFLNNSFIILVFYKKVNNVVLLYFLLCSNFLTIGCSIEKDYFCILSSVSYSTTSSVFEKESVVCYARILLF